MIHLHFFRPDLGRRWSNEQRALGDKLDAVVSANVPANVAKMTSADLEALEALTTKAGFTSDSAGNWWHGGTLVPTPNAFTGDPLKKAPLLL